MTNIPVVIENKQKMCFGLCNSFFVAILIGQHVQAVQWYPPTIYDEIRGNRNFSYFDEIVLDDSYDREFLEYKKVTIFAPENQAFNQYKGDTNDELASYHMSEQYMSIAYLKTTPSIFSLNVNNPPMWITTVEDDVYVNQAKIIRNQSVYVKPRRNQDQVLHRIDRVLDPVIRAPRSSPKAYDFLRHIRKWNLNYSVTKFFEKVKEYKLVNLFNSTRPHTFLIPVDSGISHSKYFMMDRKVILGHVVNQVVFSRPEGRVVTTTDEDGSQHELSFQKIKGIVSVKSISKHGSSTVRILVPDIPLLNGVVHIISEPLTQFFRMTPFPFLPIAEKITNDPDIDVFYKLGNSTGFNKIFNKENVSFTYFIPLDSSWYNTGKLGLEPVDSFKDILARHLVISKSPYSMHEFAGMTRASHYTPIVLQSQAGPLRISVFEIDGGYIIKWKKKYIKVLRPDYLCTNGMVHILSGPFVDFIPRNSKNRYNDTASFDNYWNIVKRLVHSLVT